MKKAFVLFALASIGLLLAECSPKTPKTMASAAPTPTAKVAEVKKNFTADQMEQGKTIWQTNCNKCHKLFEPASRDVEKWERILPSMVKRAHLDDSQSAMVRAYLLSHANMG